MREPSNEFVEAGHLGIDLFKGYLSFQLSLKERLRGLDYHLPQAQSRQHV